jgi:CheY-like chemotaxis protein
MKKKLNSVLLVDDDEDNNYIHELLLNESGCVEKIEVAYDGKEALDKIRLNIAEKRPNPAIIFLDINMPGVNGWEFLEEYGKIPLEERRKMVVIMLTTSLNPDDKERCLQNPDVQGYYNKFLDEKILKAILSEKFPEIVMQDKALKSPVLVKRNDQ